MQTRPSKVLRQLAKLNIRFGLALCQNFKVVAHRVA